MQVVAPSLEGVSCNIFIIYATRLRIGFNRNAVVQHGAIYRRYDLLGTSSDLSALGDDHRGRLLLGQYERSRRDFPERG